MKLLPETVANIVKGWGIIFPGQKTAGELAFIASQFFDALQGRFSNEGFIEAARIVRDEQEFFPTVAHVIKLQNVVADKLARQSALINGQKMIAEETGNITEAEAEQNRERVEIIMRQLSGDMSLEEAIEKQQALTTWAQR